ALTTGGLLHVLSQECASSPAALADYFARHPIDCMKVVPSHLAALLTAPQPRHVLPRKRLVLGGESSTWALLQTVHALAPDCEVHNHYGPTETTVGVLAGRVQLSASTSVPLGLPLAHSRLYVLDASLRPTPLGVPGELFVGGAQVTRGYLGRPDLTAERYVPDPFSPTAGARMYRTGDRVRWLSDGRVEFLGRVDFQVKVRGFRVEPGEVATVLRTLPSVHEAIVVARQDIPGEARLVAYVVADTQDVSTLRERLKQRLPEYMVPSAFVFLDALPLTPNGKVDRNALPIPDVSASNSEYVAPRTPTEEVLASLWAEVLRLPRVGAQDHFFELGGHSLLATQLVARVRAALSVELPLRSVFEAPSLTGLARRIDDARERASGLQAPPLVAVPRTGELPLSFAQQRLWFMDQLQPGTATYNMPYALRLEGPANVSALERAFGELIRRHESLRTTFHAHEGEPVQRIHSTVDFVLDRVGLEHLTEDARQAEVQRLAAEEALRPFDLTRGPLLRASILTLTEQQHVLLMTLHHIVSDGWSRGVLVREVATLYSAFVQDRPSPLPELPVQYADFAVWQRSWLQGEVLDAQLGYWKQQLSGAPALLELPTDKPRPAVQSQRGASLPVHLPLALSEALKNFCQHEGVTPFMALLAAFQVLLSRYSGQEDVSVGTPIAGRTRAETEGIIGFFVNTLVLRSNVQPGTSFRQLLAQVRDTTLAAYEHQHLPFEKLVEELQPQRSLSHSPLFQVMLVLQNMPASELSLSGLSFRPLEQDLESTKFDLRLSLTQTPHGLTGALGYRTDLFEPSTVARMVEHLRVLLEAALASPAMPVSELPLLTDAEKQLLLTDFVSTQAPLPPPRSVHALFEQRAALHPDSPAVASDGQVLTYGELDARANQLAWHLRSLGVGTDACVALCLERSVETVVALLGVWKAGGAYVPLDPAQPALRLQSLVQEVGAPVVVTMARHASAFAVSNAHVVRLDEDAATLSRLHTDAPPGVVHPDSLAYVLFTSGSTGRPKGVAVAHSQLSTYVASVTQRLGLEACSSFALVSTFVADLGNTVLFPALTTGGLLHVLTQECASSPAALADYFARHPIDCMKVVPSHLAALLTAPEPRHVLPRKRLVLGGESSTWALLQTVHALAPDCEVHNHYGPTETTVGVLAGRVQLSASTSVPLGWPLAHTRLYVLDASLRPTPLGVPGELLVGGAQVTRGYLGRPDLTSERYVPDPFSPTAGARMYRTGDRVRWLSDGRVEFLGRVDFQVKVRGFRVEPGEVATVLRTLPSVHEAIVVARQDIPGEARLVAYVVADTSEASALRHDLKQRLPEYMVPSAFVFLDALPLTPNGKVDRKALPVPDTSAPTSDYVAPRTPTEELLASLWAEVLRLPRVGSQDHFFDLGGHSLLATQLVARVRAAFAVDLPLRSVFEAPSLADLARRIDDEGKQASGIQAPPLVPAPRTDALPLSFAQQRLWFMDQLVPGSSTYNIPSILRLEGELHLEALRHSLTELVRRHEALRTRFPSHQGQPFQSIASPTDLPLPMVDLSPLGEAALDEARRLASTEAQRPFDLASGPLVRALLLKLTPTEHVLVFTLHHIVSDGWSRGVLVREVAALYAAFSEGRPSPLPELPVQYADYAVWQRSWLQGDVLDAQLDYWRQRLADAAPLELPIDFPRPAVQSSQGGVQPLGLSLPLANALKALAQREAVTPFMLLMAAFQVLLARYSGQEDISVGSPIAGRTHAETEGLIGFFVNTLVLRSHVASRASFRQLLQQVREESLGAYTHQDVPFERLVEELRPQRDLTRPPLFQASFSLQNTSMPSLQLPGLTLRGLDLEGHNVKAELELFVFETPDGFDGALCFNTALFAPATAQRMARHFVSLVETLVSHPEAPLASADMLSQDELHQLLIDWNDTRSPYSSETSIHQRFADQARAAPDAVAVLFGDDTLTYRQLDERANQLAHALVGLGVRPGTPVALGLGRSLDLIIAILGVLKAGAAYVPLDMSYPHERLAMLLEDSGAPVLVTRSDWEQSLPSFFGASLLMDDDAALLARKPTHAPAVPAAADSLAYVMFTSGSTGRPKGVMVPHRGVVRLVCGASYFRFGPEHRYSQLAPTAFDASTLEIWGALLHGAQLVLAPPHSLSLEELAAFIRRHAPTSVLLTAALFEQMALHQGDTLARVSQLMVGGDVMPTERARQHLAKLAPGSVLVNGYGPTENSTVSTAHSMGPASPVGPAVPIGKPIGQSTVYVLDAVLRPVPVGVAGELFVGGAGLAWGYLRRPDLTAERFVPNAFTSSPGERLYRTGDRARWRADGTLEFLGRTDFQVKVRGFRIEPGEVESALRRLPGVAETLVMAREDVPGDKRLVAYVATDGLALDAAALREHLQQVLPAHMVPSSFVVMEALPLTPNGKVDRKALPVPDASAPNSSYVAPRTPTEELLASLWAEVLNVPRVGAQDHFFELGGHSLLATQLVARVRAAFSVELPLRSVFEAPSLADLARRIDDAGKQASGIQAPPLVPAPRTEALPLSFAQQRLWFMDQLAPGSTLYNVPSVLRLEGELHLEALRHSLTELVRRHEALRTSFSEIQGQPFQRIASPTDVPLPMVDLRHLGEAALDEARRLASTEAQRPFDLASGPLVRALLLKLAPTEHVLVFTLHHIVSDGWSLGVLVREVAALYAAFSEGRPSPLPELPVQYADYAVWQRSWLQGEVLDVQLDYWRQRLADAAPLELPIDFPRPAVQSSQGGVQPLRLPLPLAEALKAFAQREAVTPFMILMAAFQVLLARYSGQEDISVGSPIAGRTHAETEDLIGFFVNTLVLRSHVASGASFRQLLQQVREAALGAYAHQDVPFERLVEELRPQRDLTRPPLFQALFALQNTSMPSLQLPGLALRGLDLGGHNVKAELEMHFSESSDGFGGSLSFNTALFAPATAQRMARHFVALVEALVSHPEAPLASADMLSQDELHQLLIDWNDTRSPFPHETSIHQRFADQARERPDAVAVLFGDDALTYRQLDERANQLAHALIGLGVRPGTPVALGLGRSLDLIIAILGVLKAGAAYVPLEMSYPHERLAMLLEDSGAPVLVTRSDWEQSLPSFFGASLLMDDDAALLARKPTHAPAVPSSADSLAYVMFTSGSTGRPKGVMVPHRGVMRLVCGASYFHFGPEHRYFQLAPTAFDASTMEIWSALLHGAQLVLAPPHSLSLEELAAFFRRHSPTSVVLTTALFEQMALHQGDTLARVSQLMIGGDVMPAERARQHLAKLAPGSVLINGYGPTENTTASTAHIMGPASPVGHSVPIGKPIGQSTVYVLDATLRPVPVGVAGEMFVGGDGLAWGYLRRPDLTAERFVPNAFTSSPGERLYRTGDRARWRADGTLEFLGRTDFQVKVRGFRIEPGEVESALQRLPGVAETLVMAREDVPGDRRLVAYVATGGLALNAAALRAHLQQQLPGHMVPSSFVVMEALPLTPNGKVDRKALPVPDASVQERGLYTPPSTPTEELLASLWSELLRVDRIGRDDDFFEVGGHSLLGTQLVSRIRTAFGIELPLRALFEATTLTRLALRVEEALQATEGSALPPPRALDRGDEAPLSFAQQRLWFLEQLQPGTATYNIPSALHLDGPLDLAALERAFRELVQRHESLRTTFHAHAGEPVQRFHATAEFTLDVQDLEHLAPDAREAEARRLAGAEGLRPFDLARGPLLRASLLRLAEHRHMLLVTMHHIVSDGWSMSILVRELDALYRAFRQGLGSPLTALPLQYADYALWQRDWLQGDALERQRAWWRQHLAGAPRALELSTDFPRPAVQSFRGASVPFLLPPELSHALQTLAQQHGATLFMALLASTQTLLARHSGQDDVVIGSPIAGRRFAELEGLIGFFINTLALRSRLDDAPTFVQLLGRMREATLGAYAHQDIPFEKLVEELQPQRDLSRSPLFQVMLMVQNAPRAAEGARPDTLTLRPVAQDSGTSAKFDLTFVFTHSPQGLVGSITYSTALFREESIRRLVGHLRVLLEAVVLAPDTRVHDLPLLPPEERQQVLLAWNDTARPFDATSAHARFEAQALRTPDGVALVSGEDRLTYRELHQRVLRLSRRIQARGVRPDEPVALCARRAPDMVVAMLAILHAGGAYLPLDPDYPADRLAWMLRDSQARVLVTQQSLRDAVPSDGLDVVFMEETGDGEAAHAPGAALPGTRAYVIYTSGSTGRPKGVMVPHHTLSNFLEAMDAVLGTSTPGTWLAVTSISFDIHVLELLWTLTRGFQVVLHDEKAAARGAALPLARLLRQHAITHLQCTPAFARSLVLAPDAVSSLGTLRHLLVGGEALPGALAVQLREALPSAVLRNMYGPTETTVWSSTHAVTGDAPPATVSIGAPIANTRLYVLDARGQPVPVGVPGELYIAGDGVVRGYLARPELTAERFVPDAFSGLPGSRMYRTGDLARWRSDGTLDFLGRTDFQLKVRGFRIEPGEVEAILVRHPSVLQAVAGARPDASGDGRLVAWVVPSDGQALEPAALRDFARQHLPEHLVPSLFMALDTLPLTPNGKVDRKALPIPDAPASTAGYVAPRTPTEEKLAALFAQVLRVARVGATDHFFELGGHSLLATQLVSRVRVAFDVELPLQALFEAPTVAEVAARIDAALQSGQLAAAPPLQRAPSDQPLPASYSQHRVWLLDQLAPGGAAFNMPLALRLSGALDVEALRRALEALVHRHESLRTTFRATSEGPIQVIAPPGPLALAPIDLSSLPADAREAEAQRRSDAEAQRPFDLATGPLLRVALLALDAGEHVLLLTLHHIISDGWSMSVMVREVVELYRAFATQTPAALAPLPLQFGDYAAWQRQWLQGDVLEAQLSWWQRQLDGAPRALELPTDRPRAPHTSLSAEVLPVEFPLALSEAVEALCRREGITPFMFLLAAFQLLLARYSGQDDISVGSPVAGRNRAELEGLIGFFLNTLVLRTRLDGDPTVRELLARVRTTALGAFAHQHVPFEQLQPMRDLHQAPLFQVMFILQNTPPAELSVPGLTFRALPSRSRAAKFDMTLSLSRTARGFVGALEYAKDFYDASTAERLMRHLHVLVKALVATPECRISELPLLTQTERRQVLVDWNATRADFPNACVHTLFEAQVRRAPAARAATFEGTHLTYAELDARANQVAHALRRRGVGPEVRVALSVERSLDVVIGLLGILKAGGAWVPVDPLLPRERRAFMLEDSGARVLLTQETLRDRFPESHRTSALCLDAERDALAREPTDAPASGVTPGHLAYLLYTSGSTGLPKGTLVEHRSVANLVTHEAMAYGIGPGDRVLQFANLSFDLSVEEIFTTLCAGATLVLAPMEKLMPGAPLQQLLREEALTVISLTPAALAATPADGLPSLRTVISGGEALPSEVMARWASRRRLINTYGPTEATVVATLTDCVADERVPAIGKPLANVRAYVLDARGEPVPVGVRGELYLGGVGVARGYAGRPALTAERFVPDAFSDEAGARLYRTGDVVRWREDGTLEFVGRGDAQVKVRGFRIELGEVEAVLRAAPTVKDAVVLVREDVPGDRRLVAYVVADALDVSALREHLKQHLPEYMVPAAFVALPALPLTANGKVDRKALPAPDFTGDDREHVPPRTDTEERLAGLWRPLLGVTRVGATDSFFDLGGHSLLATQAISRIREAFGVELPLRALFDAPTVEGLSARIDAALEGRGALAPSRRREGPALSVPLLPLEEVAAREVVRPASVEPSDDSSGARPLTDAERQQVLVDWNATAADFPRDATLPELIQAQVERTPDAVALAFEGRTLTYRELDTRANQLSHALIARGVGPEVRVGLLLERSLELVVALLATLKAGGAYVPFDPAYPAQPGRGLTDEPHGDGHGPAADALEGW
ncbi:non-ribosomal peptide synthase/polyketide synthase, partial [Corallococcus exiguus]|uniref:non-ribosomal peptide synthase/polyketide synthase n=1 Tax=Corallococcus exiguus TaxID=83462 RepID=UPI00155F8504